MHQIGPALKKHLKAYAAVLPPVLNGTCEKHIMTGGELLEMGYVEQDGEVIDPKKKYNYNMPVQLASNHYRRLKKAYLKKGVAGIQEYSDSITAIIKANQN